MTHPFEDPSPFAIKGGYRFPFEAHDSAKGPANLGHIEWHLEFVRGRKRRGRYGIAAVLAWATQTRDRRYAGRTFRIDWHNTNGWMRCDQAGFLASAWFTGFCSQHGNLVISAYPPPGAVALVIETGSSIGNGAYFEVGQ